MKIEIIFILYIIFLISGIFFEVYILVNDKYKYLKMSMRHLSKLIKRNSHIDGPELMARELTRLFTQYIRENTRLARFYPNIIVWLDSVIFYIDTSEKIPQVLLDYEVMIKEARELLEKEKPFYRCNEYQQGILTDIRKLEMECNGIVLKNILDRVSSEFLRQNSADKRNKALNLVSVLIGVAGIMVSIISMIVS